MSKRLKGLLTPKELAFVQMFNGNATEAARLAGYKEPKGSGHKLINIPEVVALIKKKQSKAIEQQGKEEGHAQALAKTFLDEELVKRIRRTTSDKAAIDGIELGYKVLGLLVTRNADVTKEFEGRSEAELDYFAKNGYWPNSVDTGKPGDSGTESLRPAETTPEKIN